MSFNLQTLTNLNPINAIIDAAGDVLGLPPEAKAIAKVGIGFLTSNPVVILDGVMELGEAAQKTSKTEWKTSSDSARASEGYAKSGGETQVPSGKMREPRDNDADCGGSSSSGAAGGASSTHSASSTTSSSLSAKEVEFYRNAKTIFDNFDKIETAGWLKLRDGELWQDDLKTVVGDPNVPRAIREAADYFLKNPEALKRICPRPPLIDRQLLGSAVLEGEKKGAYGASSASGGHFLGPAYVDARDQALRDARGRGGVQGQPPGGTNQTGGTCQPVRSQPPAGVAVGGCQPQTNPVRDILNNPSMSPNEKLEAILFAIADAADNEALDIAQQISNLQDKQAGIDKSSKEGQAEAAQAQQDIDRLSQRLQKLMERRTQMMQLISNINKAMHENAMLCISNLR